MSYMIDNKGLRFTSNIHKNKKLTIFLEWPFKDDTKMCLINFLLRKFSYFNNIVCKG